MAGSGLAARNAARVEALYAAYAGGDVAAVLAALDPDVAWHSIAHESLPWSGCHLGRDAVQGYFATLAREFEVTSYLVDRVIAQDDVVVVLASIRLVNRATRDERGFEKADVLRLRDGMIVEFHEYYDSLGVSRLRAGG